MEPLEYSNVPIDDEDEGEISVKYRRRMWYISAQRSSVKTLPLLIVGLLLIFCTLGIYAKFGTASARHKRLAHHDTVNSNDGSSSDGIDSLSESFSDSDSDRTSLTSSDDGDDAESDSAKQGSSGGLPKCDDYECHTDRWSNGAPLMAGQSLCNDNHRFGLTPDGTFILHDCGNDDFAVVYNYTKAMLEAKQEQRSVDLLYWILYSNATLQVGQYVSKDDKANPTILWQQDTTRDNMQLSKQCLHRPLMDCPYMHLRKSGIVVLNWKDSKSNKWMARNIEKCYDTLF